MTKQVQRRRGTASQHTSFTGADGELSVNTTNKSVHVHDGVTTGGIEAARADLGNVGSSAILTAAGITSTVAELNYTDGVTSAIQTQLNAKAPINNATFTGTTVVPTADINGGTIDGTVIGGITPAAGTFSSATATTGNITNVNATTVNATNVEVTAINAKDGTSAGSIADLTGVVTLTSSVLTSADINGGTIDGTVIGGTTPAAVTGTTLTATGAFTSLGIDDNAASTAVTITSTGSVGIGTSSPSGARLHVDQGGDGNGIKLANSARGAAYAEWQLSGALNEGFTFIHYNGTNTNTLSYQSQDLHFWNTNNTERLRIDASGNLGLGVVPSAWGNRKAIQNGGGTDQIAHFNGAGLVSVFANNYYWDGTSNRYVNNGRAHVYSQEANGSHLWFTSPAGTAGSPITFTQAMTLDASGNVGIGTSTVNPYTNLVTTGIGGSQGGVLDFHASAVGTGFNRVAQIYGGNGGFLSFGTGASDSITERLRIDASGNVGIGTSSPNNKLTIVDASGPCVLDMTGSNGVGSYGYATISTVLGSSGNGYGDLTFGTSSAGTVTERLRIDASGNLLVGTTVTNPIVSNVAGVKYFAANGTLMSSAVNVAPLELGRNSSDGAIANFYKDGTTVGSISVTASSTAYNTSSDYRLKDDIQPVANAADRLLQLKPINFAWKVDGSRTDGFLAHELQEVIPDAAHGIKDEVDADGKPVYQGIDQSKIVPLLTAALQEALNKIDALEARIVTLETKP